jgi:diguanylate cyclase (GGDEF)-like protein
MLKRILVLAGFVILVITVCVQTEELRLSFYVLFPVLLLAALIHFEEEYRLFLPLTLLAAGILYLSYLARFPSLEMLVFGVGHALFLTAFVFHRNSYQKELLGETVLCENSLRELENLKQKHHSRLESLHHLEKQVAGLLDLFEIARDFNDCLSFDAIKEILIQRVQPEIPFKELKMILLDKKAEPLVAERVIAVAGKQTKDYEVSEEVSAEEWELAAAAKSTKKMVNQKGRLVFPLMIDGETGAFLMAEETQPDDLAKFEVLAAYMALLVKKVGLYETVKELSIRDGLTGVFVRRHFLERFEEELKRSIKYNLPLAVLMLDIDHFKKYNDAYGHLAGDATLKQAAALLRENLRKVDIVARYGGEEFVVVLPESRRAVAMEVAERIRSSIARHNFKVYNDQTRVTVSIGISLFLEDSLGAASAAEPGNLVPDLVQLADQALYRAKEEGRNRVVLYNDLKK